MDTALLTLGNRFHVVRRLGEGAMGTVFEALDRETLPPLPPQRVALKLLRNASPEAVVRFKREFRSLQDIHHPNLVTLGELVSEANGLFFTMELVQGEDFVSWVTALPSPRDLGPVAARRGAPARRPRRSGSTRGGSGPRSRSSRKGCARCTKRRRFTGT